MHIRPSPFVPARTHRRTRWYDLVIAGDATPRNDSQARQLLSRRACRMSRQEPKGFET